MFKKIALAAMLLAALPLAGATYADAAGKKGKGKGNVAVSKTYKPTARTTVTVTHGYGNHRFRGHGKRFRGHGYGPIKCVAVGKTRRGRNIPGVRGKSFGPGACRIAMQECRQELRFRKARGFNPFGRCVVARRG